MPPLPCALLFQGASGVGLAAIQLAKMLVRNATVFVTASEAHHPVIPGRPTDHMSVCLSVCLSILRQSGEALTVYQLWC